MAKAEEFKGGAKKESKKNNKCKKKKSQKIRSLRTSSMILGADTPLSGRYTR